MHRLLPLLLLLAGTASAQTVRTVDNNVGAPTGPTTYSTFEAAHAAAVDGDTIQFVPSPTSYGPITLSRRLTVRGGNFRERAEQGGHVVRVETIGFTTSSDPQNPRDPSGSSFEGLVMYSFNGVGSPTVRNLSVRDCIVLEGVRGGGGNGGGTLPSLSIKTSVLVGVYGGSNTPNIMLFGNLILGGVYLNQANTTQIVDHNLFVNYGVRGRNLLVSNNIFLSPVTDGSYSAVTTSVFTNNLSFATSGNELPAPHPTNSGTGNLVNVNPLLVDFPTATTMATVLETDFRFQAGSPAIGAASDGTDIGPLGGATPFTSFFTGGAPTPVVSMLNVSPAVFTGSPVTVDIEAVGELGEVDPNAAPEGPAQEAAEGRALDAAARGTASRPGAR